MKQDECGYCHPTDDSETKRNIKMIKQLSDVTRKVAEGDFSVRTDIGIKDNEESQKAESRRLVGKDLVLLAKKMNAMVKKLEKREAIRRNDLSILSHDLKTPLTSMKGFVEGIIDGKISGDSVIKYLIIVNDEVTRIQAIIDSITGLKAEITGMKPDMKEFDINKLIYQAVVEMENQLKIKNVKVNLDLAGESAEVNLDLTSESLKMNTYLSFGPGNGLFAVADKIAISRVLFNLLDNAIKFVLPDGMIKITTRENNENNKDRLIEITVEDSGEGIAQEDYKKIFDNSYRGGNSYKFEGQGLGLYISKELISAHHQKIWAEKSEMGGAKFTFTLSKQ